MTLRVKLLLLVLCSTAAPAQDTERNGVSTFQSKVNLVLVPVVVRDSQGHPVGNLTKDDFELFDKGKRQTIASFSAVKRASGAREDKTATTAPAADSERVGSAAAIKSPERYLIYLFDDLNTSFVDMASVRAAAVRHLKSGMHASDRAAIYTFSGRPNLEFTGDREKLENTVSMLRVQPTFGHGGMECPDVNYYVADLIVNRSDDQALLALAQQTVSCSRVPLSFAMKIAESAARREIFVGEQDARVSLGTLRRAIRRLAEMPGQRLIVLTSSGFFVQTPDSASATAEVLDLAAKANVTISTLDARGLYTTSADAAGQGAPSKLWLQYRLSSAKANSDVLTEFAEGTGGTFFHNNNDLNAGFDRVAAAPEFSYVLGFSPSALKADGSFHSLKLRLPNQKGVTVEARRGYYALKQDPAEQAARSEIDDAVFSREVMSEIPVVLQTGYSKPNAGDPKVLVVAKVDVRGLHFQKADERSSDSLTVVSALFDQDGGYVMGTTKTVNLRLRDETLAQMDSGVTLRSEFEVKPGTYVVRLVVREAAGRAMSTLTRTVTIP